MIIPPLEIIEIDDSAEEEEELVAANGALSEILEIQNVLNSTTDVSDPVKNDTPESDVPMKNDRIFLNYDLNEENEVTVQFCEICDEELERGPKAYGLHMLTHNPLDPKPFKCPQCNEKFSHAHKYKIHRSEEERNLHEMKNKEYLTKVRPFQCKPCHRRFKDERAIESHIENYHNGVKPHPRARILKRKSTPISYFNFSEGNDPRANHH